MQWKGKKVNGFILSLNMITEKDLCDIIGNKIAHDIGKSLIRSSLPPHIAGQLCDAIDRNDATEKFDRILMEYNDWLAEQQRQQQYILQFLQRNRGCLLDE